MEVNKSDWQQWSEHPITLMFKKECAQAVSRELTSLYMFLGDNQLKDVEKKGTIKGLQALLDFEPEFESEPEEEEEDES